MDEQDRLRSMQKLIDKVGRFVRLQKRRRHLCHEGSSSTENDFDCSVDTMADKEEDFSSLPLSDRFTHKVCPARPGGSCPRH